MSWRFNLQNASFRGVPFKVDTSKTEIGRRTETHTYPLSRTGKGKKRQDFVWSQDLGAEPDSFSIEGYVIQTLKNDYDYFKDRDNLIKALKTQGPGLLIHPFFKGSLKVSLDGKAGVSEKLSSDGGIARFSMNFVQYNKPIFSQLEKDFVADVDGVVLDLNFSALDFLSSLFSLGLGAIVFLGTLLDSVIGVMQSVRNIVNSTIGLVSTVASSVTGALSSLNLTAQTLLRSPCELGKVLQSSSDSILGLVGMTGEIIQGGSTGSCSGKVRGDVFILDGITILEELGLSLIRNIAIASNYPANTFGTVPDEQKNNQEILVASHQAMLLGNASRIAIRTDFSSQSNMEESVKLIAESMDALLNRVGSFNDQINDPLLFQSLTNTRAVFVSSMYAKFTGLTQEVEFEIPSGVMSSLELAYNRYSDITRTPEIFSRNYGLIQHPGFLPNSEEINLLDE